MAASRYMYSILRLIAVTNEARELDTRNAMLREIVNIPTNYVRFEVFTAVTMKKAVFWDVAPCFSLGRLLIPKNS
jgi:hypothetical protein